MIKYLSAFITLTSMLTLFISHGISEISFEIMIRYVKKFTFLVSQLVLDCKWVGRVNSSAHYSKPYN